ncbi:MAG: hypothetical protein L0Z62_45500, partial [Gemmataceae bacterium]|nr:hypothetical protein [Gemmataceae bacterium]
TAFTPSVSGNRRGTPPIYVDGPGDTTVRPARPLLQKLGAEVRDRIAEWERQAREAKGQPPPPSQGT